MRTSRTVATIAVLAFLGVAGRSQPPAPGATADLPFLDTVNVNVVNVEVFVTDRQGDPVTNLTVEDFELFEDGQPVKITNFYAVEDGAPAAEAEPAVETPGETLAAPRLEPPLPAMQQPVPEEQRLYLIVYFDNLFLQPFSRGRVIRDVRRFLAEFMGPDDQVMVVTFERSLHLRQPFTSDLGAAFEALGEVEELSAFGVQDQAERDRVMRLVGSSQSFMDAEPAVNAYARAAFDDLKRSVGALRELVAPLAGLPGRKALLYVSDGIPMVAGTDLFRLLDMRFRDSTRGNLLALRYSARNEFRRLIDSANANRVTFYTIEASGLTSHASLSAESLTGAGAGGSLIEIDMENDMNREAPLEMMAADTGGLAAFNTNNIDGALDRMGADLRSYYSLGYSPAHLGDGRSYRLEVKVRGRGLRARHRNSYRDKSFEARLTEGVLAVLRYGAGSNTLDLRVDVTSARSHDEGRFLVPVKISVPFRNVTLVPRDEHHHGRLRLVLAVIDDQGNTSPPDTASLPLTIPAVAMDEVLEQKVVYEAELRMRRGLHQIAVGLRDELSGQTAFVRRTVSIGE